MIRKITLTILTIIAIWASGFVYYLYLINSYKPSSNTANAIIGHRQVK